ncbi:MAG: ribosomal protein S18-alanine N-acetyltransferase [Gammaproteobacteria bacterium]|nr:ribosomal protein S18-alanine N-acetyltransferase [Gammaproteobacteria bacterium]
MIPDTPANTFFARAMRASDLDLVVRNENAAYASPWSKRVFIDCLRSGYQCWVLANKNEIVAHGVMSVAIGECHLLTLCVAPAHQRSGLGRRLFALLLERAAKLDAQTCFLEVRKSNTGAIALYTAMGFSQIGERKGYYPDGASREDAVVMSAQAPWR